ncbi:unnamed protein product [Victoria cruziana]
MPTLCCAQKFSSTGSSCCFDEEDDNLSSCLQTIFGLRSSSESIPLYTMKKNITETEKGEFTWLDELLVYAINQETCEGGCGERTTEGNEDLHEISRRIKYPTLHHFLVC